MTQEFNVTDVKPFIEWLKKFNEFTYGSILLEVTPEGFKAKTYTSDKSCVKGSFVYYKDINLFPTKEINETIFAGIYDLKKLMVLLKHFDEGEFKIKLSFEKMKENDNEKLVCEYFNIINDEINFKVNCASLTGFTYIDDEKFDKICFIQDPVESKISSNTIVKIKQLAALDKCDLIRIHTGETLIFSGDNFKINASKLNNSLEYNTAIRKEFFSTIDNDECDIIISENKIVFVSDNNNSKTIIARSVES